MNITHYENCYADHYDCFVEKLFQVCRDGRLDGKNFILISDHFLPFLKTFLTTTYLTTPLLPYENLLHPIFYGNTSIYGLEIYIISSTKNVLKCL